MPRFTNAESNKGMVNEDIIDLYDCAGEEFWLSKQKVDIEDSNFYRYKHLK